MRSRNDLRERLVDSPDACVMLAMGGKISGELDARLPAGGWRSFRLGLRNGPGSAPGCAAYTG
jgi:hypothetical protein